MGDIQKKIQARHVCDIEPTLLALSHTRRAMEYVAEKKAGLRFARNCSKRWGPSRMVEEQGGDISYLGTAGEEAQATPFRPRRHLRNASFLPPGKHRHREMRKADR